MFSFFLRKEITDRYLGNSSALIWIIVHPVITLLIYNFVFGIIFKARVATLPDGAFITYLAIGLWPWMAFSESVLQAITAVVNRKDLLGKVKMDLRHVVLAGTTANFILHGIGFLVILVVLAAMDKLVVGWHLLLILIPLLVLYVLAIGLSLLFSAFYVFYRDLKLIVNALLPLLFFCTPIIYAWDIIPEQGQNVLQYNPLLPVISFIHNVVFSLDVIGWWQIAAVMLGSVILLMLANRFFQKLAPRFDDFA